MQNLGLCFKSVESYNLFIIVQKTNLKAIYFFYLK